ncbi:MAG: hypothetical protein U0W94_02795 [Buchnera aphidicola (Schlechtendalia peitan)]
MSSMSVVDGIQLVDVNKNTHPQDTLKNTNKDVIYSFPRSDEFPQFPSYENEYDPNISYSNFLNGQIIDYPPDLVINDNITLTDEDTQKIDKLKGFASVFIPFYTFVKNITPDFTVPDILKFNFTPITNFFDAILSSVSDTCVSIYEVGKNAISNTVDFVKNVGESVFDTSVNFGKSVVSTISNFYDSLTSSSDDNTEVQSNTAVENNSIQNNSEQIESKELKRPYWYTLENSDGESFTIFSGKDFQDSFNTLKNTLELNNRFISEGEDSVLQVNGQQISKYSPQDMLNDFQQVLPNLESRQLISSYTHQNLFSKPYLKLFSEKPELADLKLKDMKVSYVADAINDNEFQLVATSKANLDSSYTVDGNTYDSFGVQVSTILSKNNTPKIAYEYFLM